MIDESLKSTYLKGVRDTLSIKVSYYSKVLRTESAILEMKLDEFYLSSFIKKTDKKKYRYWQMKMAFDNIDRKLVYFTCVLGRGDTINLNNLSDKRKEYIHDRWIEFKDKQGIDIRKIKHKLELCEIILD